MAQNSNVTKELKQKVERFIRLTLKDISVEVKDEFDRNFEREALSLIHIYPSPAALLQE